MIYERIDLPSDEAVSFVGCYVLNWGKVDEPTVGFREINDTRPCINDVVITRSEYENLKRDSRKLTALEQGGVDNWQGYEYAMEHEED